MSERLCGVKENKIALLSCNHCQDLLENYFSCQWQQGGTSDNPNAAEFGCNTNHFSISITHANTAGTENSLIDDLSHKWLSFSYRKHCSLNWRQLGYQQTFKNTTGLISDVDFRGQDAALKVFVKSYLPTVKTELTKLGIMLLCLLATELTKLGIVLLCLL